MLGSRDVDCARRLMQLMAAERFCECGKILRVPPRRFGIRLPAKSSACSITSDYSLVARYLLGSIHANSARARRGAQLMSADQTRREAFRGDLLTEMLTNAQHRHGLYDMQRFAVLDTVGVRGSRPLTPTIGEAYAL